MMGSSNNETEIKAYKETGILNMSLEDIFRIIRKDKNKTYFIKCSYIEIYNDFVYDLLKPIEQLSYALTVSSNSDN